MEKEQFLCSICLDKFIQPRITDCLHSFCENCLFTFVLEAQKKTSFSNGTCSGFECPVCRKQIDLPSAEVTNQWIKDTFPLDMKMIKRMEIENESSVSTDETDVDLHHNITDNSDKVLCAPCKESGMKHFAIKFCLNCCEALCKTCCDWHKKFKLFKQHDVVLLSSCKLFKSQKLTDRFEKYTKCRKHLDKDIMAFCKIHVCFCCLHCVTYEHRECKVIHTKVTGDEAKSKANMVAEMYTNAHEHINFLLKLEKDNRDSLLSNIEEVSDKIQSFKDEIMNKLNEQYADTMSRLKEIRLLIEENTENEPRLIEMRESCGKQLEYLKALNDCKSNEHVFILSQAVQSEFSDLETDLQNIDMTIKGSRLTLEICGELKHLKDKLQTHGRLIGVKLETVPLDHKAFVVTEDLAHDFEVEKMSPLKIDVPDLCSPIFSSTCNTDENLVLFDTYSSDLYSYSLSNKTASSFRVSNAHSVLQIGNNKFIVSKPELSTVSVIKCVDGELSSIASWKLEVKPYIICHMTDSAYVVSTQKPLGFLFFNIILDLNRLQMKKHLTHNKAGKEIKATEYFIVDVKRMRLIQTCLESNEVNCRTFDGEEVFCFKNSVLECPQGVTLDKNGNIYVCNHSYFKPSVIVLSAEGILLNEIKEDVP
ncbi:E3 ubiquitin/ISG15 ligase TRIM25-like [Mercenaria mercenaria]|uniref:E3 ubiquitin/ISG15 ligase TRIM25-like n=1 Tax=Mercenaria mercenaria TaxID=6596 RepID=UPI00234E3FCE|nr:E3 ubiquitin/ISG15 ligase TRIM25-like [Mercenaria mercenaria]